MCHLITTNWTRYTSKRILFKKFHFMELKISSSHSSEPAIENHCEDIYKDTTFKALKHINYGLCTTCFNNQVGW
jgi:hypothetical protein